MMNEPLINLRPKTDFENLLWANKCIDILKKDNSRLMIERGIMKDEIDFLKEDGGKKELIGEIYELKKKIEELKAFISELTGSGIKKKLKNQKDTITGLINKNRELKNRNDELINDLIVLRSKLPTHAKKRWDGL